MEICWERRCNKGGEGHTATVIAVAARGESKRETSSLEAIDSAA